MPHNYPMSSICVIVGY